MSEDLKEDSNVPISKMPYMILRLEGVVILICSIIILIYLKSNWILNIVVFLLIDISLLGYLSNPKLGATIFNIGHTLSLPIILLIIGILINSSISIQIGIIWVAHIGYDKMKGFGLKYPDSFDSSHLNYVK